MIYLDNAATTFPKPEKVYSVVDEVQRNFAVNAGRGNYKAAMRAASVIEDTRLKLANLVRCAPNKIIFSPSATIALNQIIGGIDWRGKRNVYVSPFEHNAVIRPLKAIADRHEITINILPFDGKTQELDSDKMHNMFALQKPDVVFVNHVSNVTGLVLDAEHIFREAKKYAAATVLDASQSLGLIDIDLRNIPADFTVFAGHKNLYGHFGVGGFIINGNVELSKYLSGGTGSDSLNQNMPNETPLGFEPASPNIIAISSLGCAIDWINGIGIDEIYKCKKQLTEYTVRKFKESDRIKLYIPENPDRHISIVSFTHSEYKPAEIAEILDAELDIAVRSGYHCAPYIHELIGTVDTLGTVRVSLGFFNSKSDIDKLTDALKDL